MKLKIWENFYYRWNSELKSETLLNVAKKTIEEKDEMIDMYVKEITELKARLGIN